MRTILLTLGTAALVLGSPAMARTQHHPRHHVRHHAHAKPAAPSQMITCGDGTINTAKPPRKVCAGHDGVFAASATKTISTAPGTVGAATVATKLPNAPVATTTAMTANRGDTHATTEVTQISTPGASSKVMRTTPSVTTVRCYDGTVHKVSTIRTACKRRGGVASSVVTATMKVPAGETKSIAAKTPVGVAVATTKNPDGTASATRVTQTTVYPRAEPKPK